MRDTRISFGALAMAGVSVACTATAGAQPVFDHLKCYRAKDALKVTATGELPALHSELSDPDCRIGKAKLYCTPVAKTNVQPAPPGPEIAGQPQRDDLVCYKL